MGVIEDFKKFILRGNVVDLAVGVVIGAAFGEVVTALVEDIVTPITAIPGKAKIPFAELTLHLGGGVFKYGDFINTVVSSLIIAFTVFFFVVRPVNWLMDLRKTD